MTNKRFQRGRRAFAVASVLALGALLAFGGPAAGSPASIAAKRAEARAGVVASKPASFEVVADGLDNPRKLAFGPDGALWVAEAGRGGSGPCVQGPEGLACFGSTGAITRIADGEQQRVLRGLPSLAAPDGTGATGPADVSFAGHRLYVAMQHPGGGPEGRAPFGSKGRAFGRLLIASRAGVELGVDFARFEANHNPDAAAPGSSVDSDPYAVLAGRSVQVVVDAAGNDLLQVDREGHIKVLAVFPVRMVPAPAAPPGTTIPMQSVPTSVTRGPDGAYYVGELTGFPFPKGAARVYRVVPGHRPQVYARGFTNIVDVAFDRHGRLLVLEIAKNGLTSDDLTGALVRVGRDGARTELASAGLVAPGGLAIAPDGSFFVSNFGIFPGKPAPGLPGTGQVVRIRVKK
jgi:hypothetical protein